MVFACDTRLRLGVGVLKEAGVGNSGRNAAFGLTSNASPGSYRTDVVSLTLRQTDSLSFDTAVAPLLTQGRGYWLHLS